MDYKVDCACHNEGVKTYWNANSRPDTDWCFPQCWSVSGEPSSTPSHQPTASTASSCWHTPWLEEVVRGDGILHKCSACPCSWTISQGEEKRGEKGTKGCQRPGQAWLLQRPCCRNCCWQGCVRPACVKAGLLGEGTHSGSGVCPSPKPLTL